MKVLSQNKKAYFNYEILETIEAGIVLSGQEVKSVKLGRMSLEGSYAIIRGGEAYLIGASIPPYQPKNVRDSYDPVRTRKLLLRKKEVQQLIGQTSRKGLTLVPLKVYTNKRGYVKVELGLARRKRKHDKRESLKKRVAKREMDRALKR